MKITFVLCPSWGIETPHLGIALLVAAVRMYNYEVSVCDLNIQFQNRYKEKELWKSEEDVHWEDEKSISRFIKDNNTLIGSFVKQILSNKSEIIGFSIYNTTRRLSLELARRIKEKDKSKIIIFGGQQCFPASAAEWLIKDEAVDIVVMGEGEQTLPELLTKIENQATIDFCPGTIFKQNGKIINCGLRNPIMDLDALPFPDFNDFELSYYGNPKQLPMISSRGCCYTCVFCNTKLFWGRYRSMSGDRIFQEVMYQLKRYKDVSFFTFNDHTINANIGSLARFCDLVLEAKSRGEIMQDLSWRAAAIIRPELTFELLKKMKDSGCVELEFGIESGSQEILNKMEKGVDIEIAERVIQDTNRVGISVRANFMFGFPGETEEDFQETLGFLRRNKGVFSQVHASETFCHIDPGTYMLNHLEEFDVSQASFHPLYWESKDGKNIYTERLRRHQEFCQLAISLNIPLSSGGHKILLHKEYFLEEYQRYKDTTL
jgi:radical SAM superfamily enzyme YgiQ (UPF0313 family)